MDKESRHGGASEDVTETDPPRMLGEMLHKDLDERDWLATRTVTSGCDLTLTDLHH